MFYLLNFTFICHDFTLGSTITSFSFTHRMAKAFLLGLSVILVSFAIGEGFKTRGAMEQTLEANINPGEMSHFIGDVVFLYQYKLFSDILISEIEQLSSESQLCFSLGEVKALSSLLGC